MGVLSSICGLFQAFETAFGGEISAAVQVPPEADSFLDELRRAAPGGSMVLVDRIAFDADPERISSAGSPPAT